MVQMQVASSSFYHWITERHTERMLTVLLTVQEANLLTVLKYLWVSEVDCSPAAGGSAQGK